MEIINKIKLIDKKKILTGIVFVLLIVAIFIFLTSFFGLFQEITSPISTSPVATPEASAAAKRKPSSLATEANFLKLETDLKQLEDDLASVDLSEPKLSFPILEMNINFEK